LIALLGYLIPIQVSFKLISVLGVFTLPACMYFCAKMLGYKTPVPEAAAAFALPFLFLENHSMWGGNIPSTLAGEFSHGISLSLTILFLGTLYRGLKENRLIALNIALLAAISLTHVYTLLYVVFTSIILLYFFRDRHLKSNLRYLAQVCIPAFLISGFWSIRLLTGLEYTTSYSLFWVIAEEITPPMIWPFFILIFLGLLKSFKTSRDRLLLLGLTVIIIATAVDIAGLDFPKHIDNTKVVGPLAKSLFDDAFHGRRFVILASIPLFLLAFISMKDNPLKYIFFSILVSFFFFSFAEQLHVIDIRFLPFIYLSLFLASAVFLDKLTKNLEARWMIPLIVVLLTLFWVNDHRALAKSIVPNPDSIIHTKSGLLDEILDGEYEGYIPDWIKWNYDGFESKTLWPAFKGVNDVVSGDYTDPRVVYEHSTHHNSAGTLRAFESLPLFSGRSTLEGLYMQSSPTAPFVFYVQSEVSQQKSCPFGHNYQCTNFNLDDGIRHMQMFNVEYYIVRSDLAKDAASKNPRLMLVETVHPYEVYKITGYDYSYVTVPQYYPVVFETRDWKTVSYDWFKRMDLIDVPLLFSGKLGKGDLNSLPHLQTASSLDAVGKNPVGVECRISEAVGRNFVEFDTNCVGVPHIISMSYHPNWRVEGAEKIHLVSPSFMLVYPTQEHVKVYYGSRITDKLGGLMTLTGLLILGYFTAVSLGLDRARFVLK
ncbi:MAG TPA: hypothetical protein ENN13_03530, partial [Candidatus Altiarchaeales archaeon]|nr:hypothetical protein [Candidatus Altiarchaeales archaeon]